MTTSELFNRFSETALGWLFPPRCGLCHGIGRPPLCPECQRTFARFGPAIGVELGDLTSLAGVFDYASPAGAAVRALKYGHVTSLARPLSQLMAESDLALGLLTNDPVIVPVPASTRRARTRGFDQAVLLTEAFPNVVSDGLARVRETPPQASLDRARRLTNLTGVFRANPHLSGRRVLLIDDVLTTGATFRAAATALKRVGVEQVDGLALAVADRDLPGA